jgi:hypothetical protein
MEKWFADDTYLKKDRETVKPNIYLFGGVMISNENEIILRDKIQTIKAKYTHPNLPIKWNIKDTSVKEIYDRFGRQQEYEKLKNDSNIWRKEIFQESLSVDYKIFISCIENYQIFKTDQKLIKTNLSSYLFANALMRVGYHALKKKIDQVQVILDWPPDSNPKPYYDEYYYAYNSGVTCDKISYYSGKLKDIGFDESVYFTKCTHSTLLQFTDLIIGAFRDFIETHIQKRDYSLGKELTELVLPKFDGFPSNIKGRGVNVSSQNRIFKDQMNEILKKYVA